MKNANEIKRSLSAVKQTRQITNAMYLLSASAMRRYLGNVGYTVEYLKRLEKIKCEVIDDISSVSHPYTLAKSKGRPLYFIITADKSMCGPYNHDICAFAEKTLKKAEDPYIIMKGLCGKELFQSAGYEPDEMTSYHDSEPKIEYADETARRLCALFLSDDIASVDIIYTEYTSRQRHTPVCKRLLPLSVLEDEYANDENNKTTPFSFETGRKAFFSNLIEHYIDGFVYSAMYQSFICENIARMNAMKSATNNADKMLDELRRNYNAVRQLTVTSEITELSSAAEHFANDSSEPGV